ncbi:hypothetical protein PQR34_10705 [Paraburkholderia sediminicola]|uniref:hypothetical protein n=1 Tax=Paraburkholderia sediminicola TaxID=458836 RepID=UPI0038BA6A39
MLKKSFALCLLLCATTHSYAASAPIGLTFGAAIKTVSKMNTAADRSRVDIVAEGAGALTAQDRTIHFYVLCSVVDTLTGTKQIDGAGDCELKSTAGGTAYLHFRSDPGYGDRGHVSVDGATGDFAGIEGSVAVDVSVNPGKVGKPVFFVEGRPDPVKQQ